MALLNLADIPDEVASFESLAVWAVSMLARKAQGKKAGIVTPEKAAYVASVGVIEAGDGRTYARLEAFPPIDLNLFNSPDHKTWQSAGPLVGADASPDAPPPPPPPPPPAAPLSQFVYSQSSKYGSLDLASVQTMQDKDQNTGSGTNNALGNFFQFDMGAVYPIDRIIVGAPGPAMPGGWGGGYVGGTLWRLEVSVDGSAWEEVAAEVGFTPYELKTFSVSLSCRYVRHRYLPSTPRYLACSEFYALSPGQVH